jgi:E3 ubiquitin-protein ligase RGLG
VGEERNPYQEATLAIASTLAPFDDDQLIPVYGFGDATTNDRSVFSFFPHDKPCKGLDHVMRRYSDIVPHTRLAGPTSFAPLIYRAINIVRESQGGCDTPPRAYPQNTPLSVTFLHTHHAPCPHFLLANAGGFHILVIIADGQVTRSVDMPSHEQSVQEKETVQAIVDAR